MLRELGKFKECIEPKGVERLTNLQVLRPLVEVAESEAASGPEPLENGEVPGVCETPYM